MSPIAHDDVYSGSLRLHVARVGDHGAGPNRNRELIVFLHGFPESWASWRRYLCAFGEDHLAVAPDNRGFNASDRPLAVEQYEISHILSDIHALARHYGGGRFTLVGHDWGGIAAWHFAVRYPDMLKQLIVLNAPHPAIFQRALYADAAQRAAAQYMTRFRDPGCEARLQAIGLEQFWSSLFGEQFRRGYISEVDKENALRAWQRPGALTAMLNWYRASPHVVPEGLAKFAVETIDAPRELEVSTPTLVIWGMRDTLLLPCLLNGLEQFVPHLTIERIHDAGHGLIHEAPEQIIAIIRDWISKH